MPQAVSLGALDPATLRGGAESAPRPAPGFHQALESRAASASFVQPVKTRLSGEQAAQAIENAWTTVKGTPPKPETLAIITAQWAHETGSGASMYNYNFGGIKGSGPSGLSVRLKTSEGWGASERRITDGFRAYETATEGAIDYVKLLTRRYGSAIDAAERGDASGFVRGLKERGYFTGNEQAYARSVTRLAGGALSEGFSRLGEGAPLPTNVAQRVSVPEFLPRVSADYAPADSFVDTSALLDAVNRAALRIATTDRRDDERPFG